MYVCAGSLYESSNNYNYCFLLAGSAIAVSGVMLFATPCLQRWHHRRQHQSAYSLQN